MPGALWWPSAGGAVAYERGTPVFRTAGAMDDSYAVGYLMRIDSYITQLEAPGLSRTCNESKEEEGGVG